MIGTRLSHYEITDKLGVGGMGEVYRARDDRLGRDVAIKVLPAHLSENEALRQRFEREARAISQLTHPHICALYDIGREGTVDFLVMELVEGESLAERLASGPLSVDEVLRFGAQIAQALDRAHRQGVVHRDLKPGNVMLTRTGVKLLDFGLAKIAEADAVEDGLSQLATEEHAAPLTEEGTILGTFQYMSPEQLEGRDADSRSDIFGLGVVLYEMATGQKAFAGGSRASVIASIMKEQPTSVSVAQPATPPALEHVITRCLAKDPEDRWQSAQDVSGQLEWISQEGSKVGVPAPVAKRRRSRERVGWMAAAVATVAALALGALWLAKAPAPGGSLHAQIATPPGARFLFQGDFGSPGVLSPDGSSVVFGAVDGEGQQRLWIRSLVDGNVQVLDSTRGAFAPFWSSDGRSLGFFVDTDLKRIDIAGGAAVTLAEIQAGRGGAWLEDGRIVFAPSYSSALFVMSANGGDQRQVTTVDRERHTSHRWPFAIPGSSKVLYLAVSHEGDEANNEARIVDVDSGEDRLIMRSLANVAFAEGRLLFLRGSTLITQPFDPLSGEVSGDETVLAHNVLYDATTWRGTYTVAGDRLLYSPGGVSTGTTLTWFSRNGEVLSTLTGPERVGDIDISPDGRRLVYAQMPPGGDVWLLDLERGASSRMSFDSALEAAPIFSPDGESIYWTALAFSEADRHGSRIYRRSASGVGAAGVVFDSPDADWVPNSISPDGRFMIVTKGKLPFVLEADLYALPLDGGEPIELVATPLVDQSGMLSPDGRWLAYTSTESGRYEIYVIPFDPLGESGRSGRWQVSTNSGVGARWSADGGSLFFVSQDLMAYEAKVDTSGEALDIGSIEPLFPTTATLDYEAWEPSPDGQRFIINSFGDAQSAPLELIVGWPELLGE